ncbi:ABC transporter permease [Pseudodesulfovibrio piezophilus]|uniref:Uncharacterized protein n=1 Tax=Pseudodesulfovibrio piezophilus (strain DSM 21447 / JCM 15486 / C1TLV30) TaxID=1322246 RepID=M1WPN8_PSEP2|nr:ABC transporter permease [Pseudodesulfovibrio piezophilus]CCH48484.1 conserved membrane protein of unknown function [Pseudodesulfovibrio piezophilus C1TLV30]
MMRHFSLAEYWRALRHQSEAIQLQPSAHRIARNDSCSKDGTPAYPVFPSLSGSFVKSWIAALRTILPPHFSRSDQQQVLQLARLVQVRNIRTAVKALTTHRLRTFMAILGVFLGAFMLTLVMHISNAVGLKVVHESERLGARIIDATAGRVALSRGIENRAGGMNAATFTLTDVDAIRAGVPQVELVVPYVLGHATVAFGRNKTSCPLLGTGAMFDVIRNMDVLHGRYFSQVEVTHKALVCVLGYDIADRLFPSPAAATGQYLRFHTAEMLIVGVMQKKGQDSSGVNVDEQVYVPVTTYIHRLNRQDHVSGALLRITSRKSVPRITTAVTTLLRERHHLSAGIPDDFSVVFSEQVNDMQAKAMRLVRVLGAIGAGISFSIGTLGILSIMTIIVRARRLEIGVRRAVGATPTNIVCQFLLESVLMAGSGGVLGTGVALGIATAIYSVGFLPAFYDVSMVIGIILASVCCGLCAGAYPAWQAARVDVIAALKD